MKNMPIYEALAQAFVAEGVDTVFTLMGDANMHWANAMAKHNGVRLVHTRHEHCSCTAAISYHWATGKVGVASVTCGPGFTQTMTALRGRRGGRVPWSCSPANPRACRSKSAHRAGAVRGRGRALATFPRHAPSRMLEHVREAFHTARARKGAGGLGMPYDLQKQPHRGRLGNYRPASE